MIHQINSGFDVGRRNESISAFLAGLKPVPEPYRVDGYVPEPDEHELVIKLGLLKKNCMALLADSQSLECTDFERRPAVDENAGLFVSGFAGNGILTAEMILEVFAALGVPQSGELAERFAYIFNSFLQANDITVNNSFIAMMLTFVYHECGGIKPRHEMLGDSNRNLWYWRSTGQYNKAYYGRGLIQLTGEPNYREFDKYCQGQPRYRRFHPHSDPDIVVDDYECAVLSMLWVFFFSYSDGRIYKAMMKGDLREATAYVAGSGVNNSSGPFSGYIPARAKTLAVVQPIVDRHIMKGNIFTGFSGTAAGGPDPGAAAATWWLRNILGFHNRYCHCPFTRRSDGGIMTDCSRAVDAAYRYGAGLDMPDWSCDELIGIGRWVDPPRIDIRTKARISSVEPDVNRLRPGDLMFYKGGSDVSYRPYGVGHVNIYIGNGMLSGCGYTGTIKLLSAATTSKENYIGAKRMI